MADYPLVFRLTHDITCPRFSARVVSDGKALMAFEDGEWWCHGVNPGGLTDCGATPALAWLAFRRALEGVYTDLACDSISVEAFKREATAFVLDANKAQAERWDRARQQIRTGGVQVEAFFDSLTRTAEEVEPAVSVELLEKIVPEENSIELATAA